ncbi:nitrite reductase small subunit NirD [Hirschia litorea]|uniref:Nitrite reductase small subunit NirD n=1 Tax=Hirschia litorea TaxID=1199156 RepID=A0ABW2IHY2_9PROT
MDGDIIATKWIDVCALEEIPVRGARRMKWKGLELGLFRTSAHEVYAIDNECPHKKGPLSEGIVHDTGVTCPLHNFVIDLPTGLARGADEGCVKTFAVEVKDGRVLVEVGA